MPSTSEITFGITVAPVSSPTSIEALAFYDFENSTHPGYPYIELLFLASSLLSDPISVGITDYIYDTVYKTNEKEDACMIIPILVRPRSRGRVMLSDNNPLHKLLIDTNFLEYPEDSETSLKGIKKALEWVKQKSLRNLIRRYTISQYIVVHSLSFAPMNIEDV